MIKRNREMEKNDVEIAEKKRVKVGEKNEDTKEKTNKKEWK